MIGQDWALYDISTTLEDWQQSASSKPLVLSFVGPTGGMAMFLFAVDPAHS